MLLGSGVYFGEAFQRVDVGGVLITWTRYGAGDQQPRHRHENPTYFFSMAGSFADCSDVLGTRYPRPLELLFHPAGAWHESRAGESGRIGWNLEPTQEWLDRFGITHRDLGDYRVVSDPIRAVEFVRMAAQGWTSDGILECLISGPAVVESGRFLGRMEKKLQDGRIWTLSELAMELDVHRVHLARVFRAKYGVSVTEYMTCLRLMHSMRCLLAGEGVAASAFEGGFADQSHLGRILKSRVGLTPKSLQRKFQ
jgi:AraC-like DNA-binding protein